MLTWFIEGTRPLFLKEKKRKQDSLRQLVYSYTRLRQRGTSAQILRNVDGYLNWVILFSQVTSKHLVSVIRLLTYAENLKSVTTTDKKREQILVIVY
jgi:hypothetical protein